MIPGSKDEAKAWVHSLVEKAFENGVIQGVQFGSPVEEDRARMITEEAKAVIYKRTDEYWLTIRWKDGK